MSKFNWKRFYDELEEGDPAKFPYWMFLLHSVGGLVGNIVTGFVMAFLLSFFIIASVPLISGWAIKNDVVIKDFCTSYLQETQ